ncbi:hypothetical protein RND71_030542 [Anisodus tanguticus]|uniref:Uncharacterized protein n=1 Tax=Anisodus tanguticus TaxID=243964 RepID=A0AAE1RHD7_9SOLA|nr:hypothetical protein RND71_030542 [Anisodus tanguticus]
MFNFLKGVVGGSALQYSSAWVHYRGTSKDDGTPVSVFALTGSNANDGHLAAEYSFLLLIRVPLNGSLFFFSEAQGIRIKRYPEVHGNGNGNVCLASVVVAQTLDWKLHAFDVLSEFDGNNESSVGPMLVTSDSGTEELRNTASIPKIEFIKTSGEWRLTAKWFVRSRNGQMASYHVSLISQSKFSGSGIDDVRSKAFQAVDQFLQIVKQHHDTTSTGDTSTTSMGTSSIPGNAGLLGYASGLIWAMSSLILTGGKTSEQSSNAPASSSAPLASAVSDASSSMILTNLFPLHYATAIILFLYPQNQLMDGENLKMEFMRVMTVTKEGWDDIDPQEEPKPSPSLVNIQAAQRRPVSQPKPQGRIPGTGLRGKTTPKMSKDGDEDLWGSVAVPAPRATSQPSSSRANRMVDDDDPWAAIAAPAPSAKPLNVKRSGALDDNDPWAAIAAPVPTTSATPSIGRGRVTKPTTPRLGAQRVNRTSSGV